MSLVAEAQTDDRPGFSSPAALFAHDSRLLTGAEYEYFTDGPRFLVATIEDAASSMSPGIGGNTPEPNGIGPLIGPGPSASIRLA